MRSIISPMLPLRSPTRSMRSATGVVRPWLASDSVSDLPSRIARVAAASLGWEPAASRPRVISNAWTTGRPPRSSMPTVR
jgi:hypothetical protein